jgi:hypothetical protein
VNNCTIRFPGDVGYFGAGGTGDVTNQNVLWGDVMYINKAVDKAFGQPLVHILASATDPSTSTSGRYTFYGRYDNFTAVDNRQPLSTSFAARYINATSAEGKRYFSSGTSMIVWRDSKVAQSAFTCPAALGSTPVWYGLGQEGIVIFDEQEHPQLTASPAHVFPAETQKIHVGGSALPTTFDAGWMYLDLTTLWPRPIATRRSIRPPRRRGSRPSTTTMRPAIRTGWASAQTCSTRPLALATLSHSMNHGPGAPGAVRLLVAMARGEVSVAGI